MKKIFFAALLAATSAATSALASPCTQGCCPQVLLASTKDKKTSNLRTTTFSAPKIHCGACLEGIKSTMMKQTGVKAVSGDATKKTVTISYVAGQQNPQKLAAALAKAGWPAKEVKTAKAKAISAPCSPCAKNQNVQA